MKTRKEEVAELVKRHKEHQETKAISKLFMSLRRSSNVRSLW